MATIFIGNDNVITLNLLADSTGAYITSGTVTAQLKQEDGTSVGNSITMSYVGVYGKWRGTIEEDVALTDQDQLVIHVNVNAGSDLIGHWEIPATVRVRTS